MGRCASTNMLLAWLVPEKCSVKLYGRTVHIFRGSKCDFPSVQNLQFIYWTVEDTSCQTPGQRVALTVYTEAYLSFCLSFKSYLI